MEYTKNYKLPQWGETDRIQMEDFNEAMEKIDKGIFEQGELSFDKQEQLWSGVYRICILWVSQKFYALGNEEITESNLYLNPLATEEMAGTLVGAAWDADKKVHIGRGPELTRTSLRNYCTSCTAATTSATYQATTSLYEFTSPVNGKVLDFDLRYYIHFDAPYTSFTGGSLTLTAYEKQNGSYVSIYKKSDITFAKNGTSSTKGGVTIPVEIPLKRGVSYRFSLRLDSGAGALGRIGFVTGLSGESNIDDSQFTIVSYPDTEGSHSKVLTTQSGSTHALVMAEFQQEEDFYELIVSLDGTLLDEVEWITEQADGSVIRRVTYSGADQWGIDPTLTIGMRCSETDQLSLTKYAVLFL